jgi:hypothetical protein
MIGRDGSHDDLMPGASILRPARELRIIGAAPKNRRE